MARYVRNGAAEATLDSRLLGDWCDYRPGAHRKVAWTALAGGRPFGQSCTRHVGALLADAMRKDEAARIIPNGKRLPQRGRSRQGMMGA